MEIIDVARHDKEAYLLDPKIRTVFSLSRALGSIKLQKRDVKFGFYLLDKIQLTVSDVVELSICRSKCDILIVGVPKTLGLLFAKETAFLAASTISVDYVCILDNVDEDRDYLAPDFIFKNQISYNFCNTNDKNYLKTVKINNPFLDP